mgnify:FL=1
MKKVYLNKLKKASNILFKDYFIITNQRNYFETYNSLYYSSLFYDNDTLVCGFLVSDNYANNELKAKFKNEKPIYINIYINSLYMTSSLIKNIIRTIKIYALKNNYSMGVLVFDNNDEYIANYLGEEYNYNEIDDNLSYTSFPIVKWVEKSCGCVVVNDDRVLLIRQNDNSIGFPKGHMEIGETEIETAIRETREETGLDVNIISTKKYKIKYYVDEIILKEVTYFLAKPVNPNSKIIVQKSELIDVNWFLKDDVGNFLTYEQLRMLWEDIFLDLTNI